MSGATVTLSLDEWSEKAARITNLEVEVSNLRQRLAAAQLADAFGAVPALVDAMRVAASELVPIAMQYPSATWPTSALIAFADALENMPSADPNDVSRAIDMRKFASEVIVKSGRV